MVENKKKIFGLSPHNKGGDFFEEAGKNKADDIRDFAKRMMLRCKKSNTSPAKQPDTPIIITSPKPA